MDGPLVRWSVGPLMWELCEKVTFRVSNAYLNIASNLCDRSDLSDSSDSCDSFDRGDSSESSDSIDQNTFFFIKKLFPQKTIVHKKKI